MMGNRQSVRVGVSRERAGLFTLIAAGLFVGGYLLTELTMFELGIALLVLTAVLTALQAYFNGSVPLAILLSVAPPFGFVAESMLSTWRPFDVTILHLGLSIGFLFGVTDHLIGSQLATVQDSAPDPSYRGQIAMAALMFVVLGSYVLSSGSI